MRFISICPTQSEASAVTWDCILTFASKLRPSTPPIIFNINITSIIQQSVIDQCIHTSLCHNGRVRNTTLLWPILFQIRHLMPAVNLAHSLPHDRATSSRPREKGQHPPEKASYVLADLQLARSLYAVEKESKHPPKAKDVD